MGTPAGIDQPQVTVRLRDGQGVTVRAAETGDEAAIAEFLDSLCLEARRFRFFSGAVDIERMSHRLAETGPDRFGLLALDEGGTIVGHALCIELRPGHAEVAVEVADRLHGEGLGTILIERLAELAEKRGITTLQAEVLPDNDMMLRVFRDGFDARVRFSEGVDAVEFPSSAWRVARKRYGAMFKGRD